MDPYQDLGDLTIEPFLQIPENPGTVFSDKQCKKSHYLSDIKASQKKIKRLHNNCKDASTESVNKFLLTVKPFADFIESNVESILQSPIFGTIKDR